MGSSFPLVFFFLFATWVPSYLPDLPVTYLPRGCRLHGQWSIMPTRTNERPLHGDIYITPRRPLEVSLCGAWCAAVAPRALLVK